MRDWQGAIAPYERPTLKKSLWQLTNTLVPFFAFYTLACALFERTPAGAVAAAAAAAAFLIRVYIIQHDCGHGSFFRSARANHALGCALSVLTLLPYFRWRHDHAAHHASSGNLHRRGKGDVWTMTVREYLAATPLERLRYRLFRHPLVLFGLAPLFLFVVLQRFSQPKMKARERWSVHGTTLAIALVAALLGSLLGFRRFFAVEGTITWIGSTVAVWLFYVQHQFEGTYWASPPEWSFADAALKGSSYYALPPVLHFFTGNIGYHHVHHLSPRIPNYELEACMKATPMLQHGRAVTLRGGLRCIRWKLWDEERGALVTFEDAHAQRAAPGAAPVQAWGAER